ncbi:MAG TPA: ABC transporter permease [Gammaproteobacteria bacterium]|nr:ABC transporter permease [Gammaproteobacteria bacterium]
MVNLAATELAPPELEVRHPDSGLPTVILTGNWNLRGFSLRAGPLRRQLKELSQAGPMEWDLTGIEALDSVGAFALWETWGEKRPADLGLRDEHRSLFDRWSDRPVVDVRPPRRTFFGPIIRFIEHWHDALIIHPRELLILIGQAALDTLWLVRHPGKIPWREISATIHEAGTRALPITAIVGILIGVVISYLSAVQLRGFGAQSFIVPILGVGVIRELGPLLAAILVAGRSGSAMTAQFGVMRVTQELDALATLGISPSIRLIWPKLVALGIAMPLLTVWTDAMALAGGIFSASLSLHIGFQQFLVQLPLTVSIVNLWLGLGKAFVFGVLIAITACHFGLRVEPNTDSLGHETTESVVTSITVVILADAVFAIVFQGAGMLT